MDDTSRRPSILSTLHTRKTRFAHPLVTAVLMSAMCSLTGCSLFVMAGKVIFGDPMLTSEFEHLTGTDLIDEQSKLLIICSTPTALESRYPGVNFDILTAVTNRLKRRGINVVKADDVADWLDDNGGGWTGTEDIVRDFKDVEYIVHIKLDKLTFRVENSPTLLQGNSSGLIEVHRVEKVDGQRQTVQVFPREFMMTYPEFSPFSTEQRSEQVFEKEYIRRLSTVLALKFYGHRLSEEQE